MWRLFLVVFVTACPAREPAVPTATAGGVAVAPASVSSEEATPSAAPQPARAYSGARTPDRGIYSESDAQVELSGAPWLDRSAGLVIANQHGDGFLFVGGQAVAFVGDAPAEIVVTEFAGADQDGDQIPDQLDILIGAKKAAINRAAYGSPYREMEYPGGDVPREEGVCTDTVVRAVRNAGVDLQQTLHEDIHRDRRAFPMVKTVNANIDHRRVKTLLPHFQRQWTELRPNVDDLIAPWLPGDVIFMQTMGDARPDHIGIVSDSLGISRAPVVINNWTDGYSTAPLDIARLVPITHRFRLRSALTLPAPHGGVEGLLHRQAIEVPASSDQLVVVVASGWNTVGAALRRYDRRGDQWVEFSTPMDVTVGAAGLGGGRGLATIRDAPTLKREGDRRAPAGVFTLGTAFGRDAKPYSGGWPYRVVTPQDRFVDDPQSPAYNTWQVSGVRDDWASAERLEMYELGLVVNHNTPAEPGAGSAIFLHTWQGAPSATLGCTAMSSSDLRALLKWLDPGKRPVLIQTAGQIFAERSP